MTSPSFGLPGQAPAFATAPSSRLAILLRIHWISSAICLLGMLLFCLTGITLNHAAQIESRAQVVRHAEVLPASLLVILKRQAGEKNTPTELARPVAEWLAAHLHIQLEPGGAEWSPDEVYVALPRPGGDAWLHIDLADGRVEYEVTDRGWIAWLNDLHKGRHTGSVWFWFIDLFAAACLLFSLSGLWILKIHATRRPGTWPLVGLGVLLPLLIALLFIH